MVLGSARGQRLVPATVIIDSFRQMLGAAQQAIAGNQPADPFLHVLDSLEVTAVFESMKAIDATKKIARDLLEQGLLRGDTSKIDQVVASLMAEGEKELHGKHLFPEVLRNAIGLPVTVMPSDAPEAELLRELFVRMERYAAGRGLAKYVATRQGGIDVNIQVAKLDG